MIKKLIRIIKEIKTVGFSDWFWFVYVLKRDEFSHKLRLGNYIFKSYDWNAKLCKDRRRAHNVEIKLSDIK